MTKLIKGTKQFQLANLALFSAGFITFANLYITQPLMPEFTKEFGISPAVASLSLSVATLTLAFSLLLFGSLSEAWGRKRLMTVSIFIASILTITLAFSQSYEMLIALRIIQGFVFAGVPAIAMAYLAEEVDGNSLGVAMGLYISGTSIGGMSGRIIMGSMSDLFSWQVGVIILGVVSLAICFYFVWALPPSKHFVARPLQFKPLVKSLFHHLRDSTLVCLFAIGFLLMGSFVTMYNYISFKFLEEPYALSATIVGWIFLVYLVGTFSSAWFGSLSSKYGKQPVLYLGIIIFLAGLLLTIPGSLFMQIIGLIIFTFGFFAAHSVASGWVSARATQDKAQASSIYLFAYYFGSSVAGTTGGYFWMNYGWSGIVGFLGCGILICLSCAMYIHYANREQHATP